MLKSQFNLFGKTYGTQQELFEGQTKKFGEQERVLRRTISGKRRWTREDQLDMFPENSEQLDLFLDDDKISIDRKIEVLQKIDASIPEASRDKRLSLKDRVKKYLDEKQSGREFKDVGERVGGSRKELSALRKLNAKKLLDRELADQVDFISKENTMAEPNWEELKEKGFSPGSVFIIKNLWDRVKQKPDADAKAIKKYVELLPELFDQLTEKPRNIHELRSFFSNIFSTEYSHGKKKYLINLTNADAEEEVEGIKQSIKAKITEIIDYEDSDKIHQYVKTLNEYISRFDEDRAKEALNRLSQEYSDSYMIRKTIIYAQNKIIENEPGVDEYFGHNFALLALRATDNTAKIWNEAVYYNRLDSEVFEEGFRKYLQDKEKAAKSMANQYIKIVSNKEDLEWQLAYNGRYYGVTYLKEGGINRLKKNDPEGYEKLLGKLSQELQKRAKAKFDRFQEEIADTESLKEEYLREHPHMKIRDEDWSFLEAKNEKNNSGGGVDKNRQRIHDNPPLSHIIRKNGRKVEDNEIATESIVEDFGFGSVQLGHYVTDSEAKEHVRYFLASMKDLEDILDIDIAAVHKIGGLSISFGARGRGSALAHYEPSRSIINLAKRRGDGSVAHEWAHFLDHLLGRDIQNYSLKNWSAVDVQDSDYYPESIKGSGELGAAVSNIINYFKNYRFADVKKEFKPSKGSWYYPRIKEAYNNPRQGLTPLESAIEASKRGHYKSNVYNYIARLEGEPIEVRVKSRGSQFYADAADLGNYWKKGHELFARAFEAYVVDMAKSKGMWNNYLVGENDTENESDYELKWFSKESLSKAYPQGQEREEINKLFDELFDKFRTVYGVGRNKKSGSRTDEVIELKKSLVIKSFGVQLNAFGTERPGHKYIERKPDPKRPGKYIYLYELPSGKKSWKNEEGETVEGLDPDYQENRERAEQEAREREERKLREDQTELFEPKPEPPLKKIADSIEAAKKKDRLDKLREHEALADRYIKEANTQRDMYLFDLDEVALENGLEKVSDRFGQFAVKSRESIMNKFNRNEVDGREDKNYKLTDVLRSTLVIKTPEQLNDILESLEMRGYEVYDNDLANLFEDKKPGYKHIAIKLVKGNDDPLVKELLLMQPHMLEAKYGLGHDVYDLEKNVRLSFPHIEKYEDLKEIVDESTKVARNVMNSYYAKAYEKDNHTPFSRNDSSTLAAPSVASRNISNRTVSRKPSSVMPSPPKAVMYRWKSRFVSILQPISQRFKSVSAENSPSEEMSSAIDLINSSIFNPTANIIDKYTTGQLGLFKSLMNALNIAKRKSRFKK